VQGRIGSGEAVGMAASTGRGRAPDVSPPVLTTPTVVPTGAGDKLPGVLAVAGLVVAFSLSSTLVKLADSPGVLVAFWRMALVSVVWNGYLWSRGRRVRLTDLRRALVPGLFLGCNLVAFFVGATHNSVANAALIGSMSPLLIVPLGAVLFAEQHRRAALGFALVALGGVVLVLRGAPAGGDASTLGNVLGGTAMLLWVGYVVSSRAFRGELEVSTFLAAACPIAALAVLPLAVASEGSLAMSRTGWTWTVVMTVLTGVTAHGLLIFAQRTVQVGSIGVSQVVQPALAVVWSSALLHEVLRPQQALGIAVTISGLLAFLLLNRPRKGDPAAAAPVQGPRTVPEVLG
jgi:drug/metabolite transporter (DMT)-like permease